jgi:hypothetical protein
MFASKVRAYASVALVHEYQTMLERLARDNYSSLLQAFVNYGQKCFITFVSGIFPRLLTLQGMYWCQSYKTFFSFSQ